MKAHAIAKKGLFALLCAALFVQLVYTGAAAMSPESPEASEGFVLLAEEGEIPSSDGSFVLFGENPDDTSADTSPMILFDYNTPDDDSGGQLFMPYVAAPLGDSYGPSSGLASDILVTDGDEVHIGDGGTFSVWNAGALRYHGEFDENTFIHAGDDSSARHDFTLVIDLDDDDAVMGSIWAKNLTVIGSGTKTLTCDGGEGWALGGTDYATFGIRCDESFVMDTSATLVTTSKSPNGASSAAYGLSVNADGTAHNFTLTSGRLIVQTESEASGGAIGLLHGANTSTKDFLVDEDAVLELCGEAALIARNITVKGALTAQGGTTGIAASSLIVAGGSVNSLCAEDSAIDITNNLTISDSGSVTSETLAADSFAIQVGGDLLATDSTIELKSPASKRGCTVDGKATLTNSTLDASGALVVSGGDFVVDHSTVTLDHQPVNTAIYGINILGANLIVKNISEVTAPGILARGGDTPSAGCISIDDDSVVTNSGPHPVQAVSNLASGYEAVLTIEGALDSEDGGIVAQTIMLSGKLTSNVSKDNAYSSLNDAIRALMFDILDGSEVTATTMRGGAGIMVGDPLSDPISYGSLFVSESTVTAVSNAPSNTASRGIYATGNLTTYDSTVNASGWAEGIFLPNDDGSYGGLFGSGTLTGTSTGGQHYGIVAGSVDISHGDVIANGGAHVYGLHIRNASFTAVADGEQPYGLYITDSLRLQDSDVTGKATALGAEAGLYVGDSAEMRPTSTLTGHAPNGKNGIVLVMGIAHHDGEIEGIGIVHGIYSPTYGIYNEAGTVTGIATGTSGDCRGISVGAEATHCHQNIEGTLIGSGYSYGVYVNGNVTLEGWDNAVLEGTAVSAAGAGVYVANDLRIENDGTLTGKTVSGDGVRVEQGYISVASGTLTGTATSGTGNHGVYAGGGIYVDNCELTGTAPTYGVRTVTEDITADESTIVGTVGGYSTNIGAVMADDGDVIIEDNTTVTENYTTRLETIRDDNWYTPYKNRSRTMDDSNYSYYTWELANPADSAHIVFHDDYTKMQGVALPQAYVALRATRATEDGNVPAMELDDTSSHIINLNIKSRGTPVYDITFMNDKYDTPGGTAFYAEDVKQGERATGPLGTPTPPAGSVFDFWAYQDGTPWLQTHTFTSQKNIYPVWERLIYTARFMEKPRGESGNKVYHIASFFYGESVSAPAGNPAPPTGKAFGGWVYSGGGAWSAADALTEDTVLYPVFQDRVSTVSFHCNYRPDPQREYTACRQLVKYQQMAKAPDIPALRTGYDFVGWYSLPVAENTNPADQWNFSNTITSDLKLYAGWRPKTYTVTLETGGGIWSAPLTGEGQRSQTITVSHGETFELPGISREGYVLTGWATRSGAAWAVGTAVTENLTLTAQWSEKTQPLTVSFDYQSGSGTATAKEVVYRQAYGVLPIATRTGYSFTGWYTAPSGGELVTASSIVQNRSNHTLYARWDVIELTVTFDYQEGKGSEDSMHAVIGKPYGKLPAASRAGHAFEGWYTSESGGNRVSASTIVTATADHTLYARWRDKADGDYRMILPERIELAVNDKNPARDNTVQWESFRDEHLQARVVDSENKSVTAMVEQRDYANVNFDLIGEYTVTITATVNTAQGSRQLEDTVVVAVIDRVKPVVSVQRTRVEMNRSQDPKSVGMLLAWAGVTAADNYDSEVQVVHTFENTTFAAINWNMTGEHVLVLDAVDSSGNQAEQRQSVVIAVVDGAKSILNHTTVLDSTGTPLGSYQETGDGMWIFVPSANAPASKLPTTGVAVQIPIVLAALSLTGSAFLRRRSGSKNR